MGKTKKEEYLAWRISQLRDLPYLIQCPKCNGSGTSECSHCGSEGTCEMCGGSGKACTSEVLTFEFYLKVRAFEEDLYFKWVNGKPVRAANGCRYPINPMEYLMNGNSVVNPKYRQRREFPFAEICVLA